MHYKILIKFPCPVDIKNELSTCGDFLRGIPRGDVVNIHSLVVEGRSAESTRIWKKPWKAGSPLWGYFHNCLHIQSNECGSQSLLPQDIDKENSIRILIQPHKILYMWASSKESFVKPSAMYCCYLVSDFVQLPYSQGALGRTWRSPGCRCTGIFQKRSLKCILG